MREAASARRAGVLPPGVAQDVDVPESGLAPNPEPAQNRKHPKKVAIHSEGVFLMKIFLDTANLEEIRQGVALGVVDGQPPVGIEGPDDTIARHGLLRKIGYKL